MRHIPVIEDALHLVKEHGQVNLLQGEQVYFRLNWKALVLKIGRSRNIDQRMMSLTYQQKRRGVISDGVLLCTVRGTHVLETALHKTFGHLRRDEFGREWFTYGLELCEFLTRLQPIAEQLEAEYQKQSARQQFFETAKKKFASVTELREWARKNSAHGGRKRAANMTRKQRSESARKAALARWGKAEDNPLDQAATSTRPVVLRRLRGDGPTDRIICNHIETYASYARGRKLH